jgi:endonuclease/exonuclease/phosphatase family metal-dependent hydrolase
LGNLMTTSPIRFVTSNLLHGRSLEDGQVDVQRMVTSLAALNPTVLAMQEVDRYQARSHGADLVREVAAAIPGAHWRFVPAIMGVPGEDWRPATDADPASGHDLPTPPTDMPAYGTGLITTLPVQSWHVIRVKPFRFRAPVFIPGINKWMMIDDEPRVCIAAVVEFEGRMMTVAGTHASFVPGWNIPQLRQITKALRALPAPRVLLGDLNLPAPIPAKVLRWESLANGLPTFPSPNPKMQLDHVLLDDPGARLVANPQQVTARSELLNFSDHRAIIVDVRTRT